MREGHLNIGAADLDHIRAKEIIIEKGIATTTITIIVGDNTIEIVLGIEGDQDPMIRNKKTKKMTLEEVAITIKEKNQKITQAELVIILSCQVRDLKILNKGPSKQSRLHLHKKVL
jgi:pseudouridine-5'-phosphate glycosidase